MVNFLEKGHGRAGIVTQEFEYQVGWSLFPIKTVDLRNLPKSVT